MKLRYTVLLLVPFSLSAQQIQADANFSIPSEVFEAKIIDQAHHVFYYDYATVKNTQRPTIKKHSTVVLEIGNQYSKFTDQSTRLFDSLTEKFSHQSHIQTKEINLLLKQKVAIGFSPQLFKNLNQNRYFVQANVYSYRYSYENALPHWNWQMQKEKKHLMNYPVTMATTTYGGRQWTAWYTEEIPINNGPYVFGGLPGLILELYDDQRYFHFIIKSVQSRSIPIYQRNEKEIQAITREEFRKAEQHYYEQPQWYHQTKIYSSPGVEQPQKNTSLPYNPIELE